MFPVERWVKSFLCYGKTALTKVAKNLLDSTLRCAKEIYEYFIKAIFEK
jgi:hypothetical protein